jgi:peptide/nickel transport system substrate-binding protein/oligopeptide transport system substrate-binding protein
MHFMPKKVFIVSQGLLFMGILALVMAGCGGGSGSGGLASRQVLNFPNIGTQDVKTLDPGLLTDLSSNQALQLISNGLVSLDPSTLKVVPDLASSWDTSADGKTWTFHLRSGLKFSNGDPLTASDVAYTLDRAFSPEIDGKSGTASYYLGINDVPNIVGAPERAAGKSPTIIGTGVVATSDTTLQINLIQPAAYFLDQLTYPVSWVVDKKVVDQYGPNWWDGHFVGAGPFILKSWVHKSQLTFVPNPNWYGPRLTLTEVDMPMIVDPNTAWNNWQSKQADIAGVPAADYPIARALGKSEFFEGPALNIQPLVLNSKVAPFDNLTVRQAFAEAVDRDTIAGLVWNNTVLPSDHLVPQGMPGYFPGLKGLPFNPQDAKAKLLSVYPDVSKVPPITFEYPKGSTDEDKMMAKVQQDYQTYLGVHVNLNSVDFGTMLNDLPTLKVQAYQLGWIEDYPDPQDTMDLFISGSPNDQQNFSNAQVDSLIKQGDILQDLNARTAAYNQAEEIAVDQVAWIPVFQAKNIYVFQKYVRGFTIDAQGRSLDNVWPNVQILSH